MSVSLVGIGDEEQEKREFAARHLKRETEMRLFGLPFQIVVTITTTIYQPIVWHPLEHSRPLAEIVQVNIEHPKFGRLANTSSTNGIKSPW